MRRLSRQRWKPCGMPAAALTQASATAPPPGQQPPIHRDSSRVEFGCADGNHLQEAAGGQVSRGRTSHTAQSAERGPGRTATQPLLNRVGGQPPSACRPSSTWRPSARHLQVMQRLHARWVQLHVGGPRAQRVVVAVACRRAAASKPSQWRFGRVAQGPQQHRSCAACTRPEDR